MSFDIHIGNYDGNITGNLGAFFAWAIHGTDSEKPAERSDSRDAIFGKAPVDGLKALDGMEVAVALPLLRAAVERVEKAEPVWLERFDSPNGWGTWSDGYSVLKKMTSACVATLEEGRKCRHCDGLLDVVRVSW